MRKRPDEMATVLAHAFSSLAMLAKNSLTPTQERLATERAGNCLWALGIEEYAGFKAVEPEPLGEIIDIDATLALQFDQRPDKAP